MSLGGAQADTDTPRVALGTGATGRAVVPSGTQWYPVVPSGTQWYPVVPVSHSRAPSCLTGFWGALWPHSLAVPQVTHLHRAAPAPLMPTLAAPPGRRSCSRSLAEPQPCPHLTGHEDRHLLTAHWHSQCQIQEDGTWHSLGWLLGPFPSPQPWGTGAQGPSGHSTGLWGKRGTGGVQVEQGESW